MCMHPLLPLPQAASDARGNKGLRLLKLARLLKLLRLMRLNRLVQRYEEEYYALASGFAMLKILIAVVVIGHWLACLWYYFGAMDDPNAIRPDDGKPIKGWVESHFGGQAAHTGYFPVRATHRTLRCDIILNTSLNTQTHTNVCHGSASAYSGT